MEQNNDKKFGEFENTSHDLSIINKDGKQKQDFFQAISLPYCDDFVVNNFISIH